MALAQSGHEADAATLLEGLHEDLDRYSAWGETGNRLLAVEAEVALAARRSCDAARDVVARWTQGDGVPGRPLPAGAASVLAERLSRAGCTGS